MSIIASDTTRSIKEVVKSYDSFKDEIFIMEFDSTSLFKLKNYTPLNPTRFDSLIIIGITEGELEIHIDYNLYKARKKSILMIMPSHITHFTKGSDDIKGWVLSVSKTHLHSYSGQKPSMISYMQMKKNPLTQLEHDEYESLSPSLEYVKMRIYQHMHLFHKEAVTLALQLFFIDMGNLFLGKKKYHIAATLSRKEELFADFQNLLRDNCKKQHDVKFYADQLCITTQYLSSILKEQSGRSASQWIQEALIIEAKGLLKSPRINVQQIADKLFFPDQSTFGKFFKKHTGVSPMTYRKS